MPITITPVGTPPTVGPGFQIGLFSDYSGTLPAGSKWTLNVSSDDSGFNQATYTEVQTTLKSDSFILGTLPRAANLNPANSVIADGASVYVTVQLQDPTPTTLDTGQTTATWQSQTGLGIQQAQNATWLEQQAFQTTDRTNLQTTLDNTGTILNNWENYTSVTLPSLQDVLNTIIGNVTSYITSASGTVAWSLGELFSMRSLDLLTLSSLTGNGATCDPIDVDLIGAPYGIILRATTIPDDYYQTGPGDNYYPMDLAVMTIFRGGDLVFRHGLHTTTYMLYPLPETLLLPTELGVPVLPPMYHVHVDWGTGVCGELYGMNFP